MKLTVSTSTAFEKLGIDSGLRAIREAGFKGINLDPDALFPQKDTMDEEYLAYLMNEKRIHSTINPIKEGVRKYGLAIDQIHAPTAYVARKPRETDIMRQSISRCIELCEELSCPNIVIHPICDGSARYPSLSKEDEYRLNIQYFSSILPLLKKYHVICCIENAYCLDWGTKKAYTSACSDMKEANRYIDELNAIAGEKCFAFCMDIGHLLILGIDPCRAMEKVGERLAVLHIHDNGGYLDDHTAPFLGVYNWDRFIKGLRTIGYHGNINCETGCLIDLFPKELTADALRLLAATANYFREKIFK